MYNQQAHDYESTSFEVKDVVSVQVRITKKASTYLEALTLIKAEIENKITSKVLDDFFQQCNQFGVPCRPIEEPN